MASQPVYNVRSLTRMGTALTGLRRTRGLTQAQAAQRAGVSRQWLVAAEGGKTEGLELGRLMALLDSLGATLLIRDDLDTDDA
ncbi:MAG TPA: helix-turn-helix domain-containing protein [Arachnia sp.]|nr:helix-turn-helix domain-containing protein [Arachnia sp.]HMT86794.1 helix-turn-helix domain-containing protein [Arachnia sp.]